MIHFKKFIYPILLIVCFGIPTIGTTQNLSKKGIESAINTMAKLIEENYVFADKGKRISSHLLQEYKEGKFNHAQTWQDFASLTTKSLRDYSQDGHLYVKNDPITVTELRSDPKEETDTNESVAKLRAIENNYGFNEVKILEGNVGYIKISEININERSLPVLFASMQFIANTKALIIDLQNNGGGGSDVGPFLESFFLPKNTPLLEFKRRDGGSSVEKTLDWLPQERYQNPLFIIVNDKTASAAEYFTFVLQVHKRASIVGRRSAGAANMNSWYVVNDQLYLSVSTASPTIPGTEESWEQKGIQPDHIVEDTNAIEFILNLVKH